MKFFSKKNSVFETKKNNYPAMVAFLFLALAGPFFLWPIEKAVGFPEVIEEIAKAAIVLGIFYSLAGKKEGFGFVFLAGLLFSFSESFLYLTNFFAGGVFEDFGLRLILTSVLHVSTMTVMFLFLFLGRFFLLPGAALAIAAHLFFNNFPP